MSESILPEEIVHMLSQRLPEERRAIFKTLRTEFPIHDLEQQLNTSAEVILEAISRASDLTLRGIRGIIAEAAFKQNRINSFTANGVWTEVPIVGDQPYDFAVKDDTGQVTIQVKMQRQKEQRPMWAPEASKRLFSTLTDHYVVETQRTRGGTDKNGGATRPYRYGEFDILAVALHPSTRDWSQFLYTVERWLIPTPESTNELFKYQPVPREPNEYWTDSLETAIGWFRSGIVRRLPDRVAGGMLI
jgi:hypothetical protein